MERQNKPLRPNNIDSWPKYSNNIQDKDTNKRRMDSGYSFAKDVNAIQSDGYNKKVKSRNMDSGFSFDKNVNAIQSDGYNEEANSRNMDSGFSFAKDVNAIQNSGCNEEAKSRNMDSGYSFAKDASEKQQTIDTDKDRKNVVYDNSLPQNRNIWKHRNTSNPDFFDIDKNKPEQILRCSLETNTSGMTYDVISHSLGQKPAVLDSKRSKNKRQAKVNCRKIQAVVIIIVVLVLGAVAFFIVRNFTKKDTCDQLSTVENGNVIMSDGSKAVVQCKHGYGTEAELTLTCSNGGWNNPEPCPLTSCVTKPVIHNGRIKGENTTFGSVARLHCDPGFMLKATTSFTCLENGTWSSDMEPECVPHPCGVYSLLDIVLVREDFSHINMTIETECEDGFKFVRNSTTYIVCENGSWINEPKCDVPGIVSIETQNNSILSTGRPFSISCRLTESPDWDTLLLARADSNTSELTPLIIVSNTSGNIADKTVGGALHYDKQIITLTDGILLTASFNQVQCSDTGHYICSVLVGDIFVSRGNKTKGRQFTVIDRSSQIEVISAKTMLTQGEQIEVRCSGKIGFDQSRSKEAKILIKLKYKNESTADTMHSMVEYSDVEGCQYKETINSTFRVKNDMDEAELQCVLETVNGEKDKRSVLLNVATTTVHITASSPEIFIGDTLNISAKLSHIRGWETLEITKVCEDNHVLIAQIKNDENISSWTTDKHIIMSHRGVAETSAKIDLSFNETMCTDVCLKEGRVLNVLAVKLIEDELVEQFVSTPVRVRPSEPMLTAEQDKFYRGQEATVKCTGNVGIPSQKILLKQNSDALPERLLDKETQINKETCENVTTVRYSFIVTENDDDSNFTCEIGTLTSTILTVNVSDPILYFTDESKIGEIGNNKTIQCVLSSVVNLTSVVVSRHTSETPLCEVSISELDQLTTSCKSTELSVKGKFSDDGNMFTTSVTFRKVSCDREGLYVCKSNTAKTEMDFKVTSTLTEPYLRLPETLVEDQATYWEDVLNCTAHSGYPSENRKLKIQVKMKNSPNFQDFSDKSEAKECLQNTTIALRQQTLQESYNGSTIRCVILDKDDKVLTSSQNRTIRLLKNVCVNGTADNFYPHPFDCRLFIRCVGEAMYVQRCAEGSCTMTDSDQICNSLCPSTDC